MNQPGLFDPPAPVVEPVPPAEVAELRAELARLEAECQRLTWVVLRQVRGQGIDAVLILTDAMGEGTDSDDLVKTAEKAAALIRTLKGQTP